MKSSEPQSAGDSGMFSLAEEIMLLTLLEKKDSIRVPSSLSLPFLLAGAVLVDLILMGSAKLADGRLMSSIDLEPCGDEVLWYAFNKIQQGPRTKKLEHWVYLLGVKERQVMKGILLSLVDKGALLREGSSYVWPVLQPGTRLEQMPSKYQLKREIRDAVLAQAPLGERLLALLVLLDASGMLDHLFTQDEIIFARKRVKQLKNSQNFPADTLNLLNRMADAVKYAVSAAITG